MPDQWEDAAKNFKPAQGKAAPATSPDKADDSWKVWQKPDANSGTTYTDRQGGVHQRIPEGTPIQGSPILPGSQIIPSLVGYGATRLAQGMGAPEWAANGAGLISGIGTQSGISKIAGILENPKVQTAAIGAIPIAGKIINAIRNPEPFQPVRPNPAVAARMRFGGPVDMAGGPAYSSVGMSGAPAVEPIAAPSFQPNKVNPNIARNLRFTPAAIDSGGNAASAIPSRIAGTPAADLPPLKPIPSSSAAPPAYSGPNRVNPSIAKNLRFTPGETQGGAASPATLGTRAGMMRQIRLRQQGIAAPDQAAEAIEPRTFANGGIQNNIRRR